jgi:hypothetical protein
MRSKLMLGLVLTSLAEQHITPTCIGTGITLLGLIGYYF